MRGGLPHSYASVDIDRELSLMSVGLVLTVLRVGGDCLMVTSTECVCLLD